jgi:hypothetical protein
MPTKEEIEKMLELLAQASRDDLDELLHDLLERTHPTETSQRN